MLIDTSADVIIPVTFTDPFTGTPFDPDDLPVFRVMGQSGPIAGATGTGAYLEGKDIDGITTGAVTTITCADHGLISGVTVSISGAGGTAGVDGEHRITVVDANTFTFDDTATSGTYTSGAAWHTPGLFGLTLDAVIRGALEVGRNYLLLCYGNNSSDTMVVDLYFTVVA